MALTRRKWIERTLRQIYGDQPSDDANITVNLVNTWLPNAIGAAAKANYTDNLKVDGIAYINGSFYTTFKGLPITQDEEFVWKISLPDIPFGLGANEGLGTVQIKDGLDVSKPLLLITQSQKSFMRDMRVIPNKILAYPESEYVYVLTDISLGDYTASVTMVSGGDSSDLDSVLNVPADYDNIMVEYVKQQLVFQRNMPQDTINDGVDAIKTV